MCPVDSESLSPNWPEIYQAAYRMLGQSSVPTQLRIWIQPLQVIRTESDDGLNHVVELQAPNEFAANWVKDHYHHLIEAALTQVTGSPHAVKITFPVISEVHADSTHIKDEGAQPSLLAFQNEPLSRDFSNKKDPKVKEGAQHQKEEKL